MLQGKSTVKAAISGQMEARIQVDGMRIRFMERVSMSG